MLAIKALYLYIAAPVHFQNYLNIANRHSLKKHDWTLMQLPYRRCFPLYLWANIFIFSSGHLWPIVTLIEFSKYMWCSSSAFVLPILWWVSMGVWNQFCIFDTFSTILLWLSYFSIYCIYLKWKIYLHFSWSSLAHWRSSSFRGSCKWQ